ncbi:AAA family ATPase [Parvibium lacunae]|uniref:ATPase n=1 Tax=Parvibium lacunae TaxID=1888893 RepID=A0A368L8X8_9BURK|nr:AAA family ATPase [Parvibium lacunae]RCS59689.1 ATPase [Parvibium lacunae]
MQYRCGLVVGKFCPLHFGHEYLINKAAHLCDKVIILSYTKPGFQGYETTKRQKWLNQRFPQHTHYVLCDESLKIISQQNQVSDLKTIPNDHASDFEQREFIAWFLMNIVKIKVDAVFTSEPYGDGFAAQLQQAQKSNVAHESVDLKRTKINISGTRIRSNPYLYRQFLSDEVYSSLIKKVVFLGAESSGKTTLAKHLADTYETEWAPEYGRQLWEENGGKLTQSDMLKIAQKQIEIENKKLLSSNQYLFCDTSPASTLFYCQHDFSLVSWELLQLAQEKRYDFVFLCEPDFGFKQDGTRRNETFQGVQHEWLKNYLKSQKIQFYISSGSLSSRLSKIKKIITQ